MDQPRDCLAEKGMPEPERKKLGKEEAT